MGLVTRTDHQAVDVGQADKAPCLPAHLAMEFTHAEGLG